MRRNPSEARLVRHPRRGRRRPLSGLWGNGRMGGGRRVSRTPSELFCGSHKTLATMVCPATIGGDGAGGAAGDWGVVRRGTGPGDRLSDRIGGGCFRVPLNVVSLLVFSPKIILGFTTKNMISWFATESKKCPSTQTPVSGYLSTLPTPVALERQWSPWTRAWGRSPDPPSQRWCLRAEVRSSNRAGCCHPDLKPSSK